VRLRADLYTEAREKYFASAGDRTPVVQYVDTILTELPPAPFLHYKETNKRKHDLNVRPQHKTI
jgi:hypothetical protein